MSKKFSVTASPRMGCDPELFVQTPNGVILGSEKVIPPEGIFQKYNQTPSNYTGQTFKTVVRDGVQIELHPRPDTCRARMSNQISDIFRELSKQLGERGLKICFEPVVEVSEEEFATLSHECKEFGCEPSFNYYDKNAAITVDPQEYRIRAAGGHLHFDLTTDSVLKNERVSFVPVLDVLVGNTCVLLDRHSLIAERRKVYGRAGEYRLPKHGLEYRTLSNFWLTNYRLMSFVFGMSRLAYNLWRTSVLYRETEREIETLLKSDKPSIPVPPNSHVRRWFCFSGRFKYDANWTIYLDKETLINRNDYEDYGDPIAILMSKVDLEKVALAINTNDVKLAKETWDVVREFLRGHLRAGNSVPFSPYQIDAVDFFLKKSAQYGLRYWFKADPIKHWTEKGDGHGIGWESFLSSTVRARYSTHLRMKEALKKRKEQANAEVRE